MAGFEAFQRLTNHLSFQALTSLKYLVEHIPKADPTSQLEVMEKVLWTLRYATAGKLIPGADGGRRQLTQEQVRLVNSITPEAMKMLNKMEKDMGHEPKVHLFIAEMLGYDLGTQSTIQQAGG